MSNVTGIHITIKAWLPTGKGLDEQFKALSLVKTAHETGDYAPLLSAAKIEAVQTEQKTRRMEDAPTPEPQLRDTFEIPDGHYAVRDENGVATGEILPNPAPEPAPIPANAEPASTDDALAERPALDEPDGTVTEPALIQEETPAKRRGKAA